MISRSLRLYWLLGLFLFSAALLIIGIQWVQASDTVPASDDAEGYCTTTASAVSGSGSITVTRSGSNCILTFKTSTNTTTAVFNWTPPSWLAQASQAEYLVAAGGASGTRGICSIYWGQGGGGGGVATGFANFGQSISVTVGGGGAGSAQTCISTSPGTPGNNGKDSSIGTLIVATGGLAGNNSTTNNAGRLGGLSGSPSSSGTSNRNNGGIGTASGNGSCSPGDCQTGGGGGAGGAGSGVNGGSGVSSSISGSSTFYGSGGAGRGSSLFGTVTDGGGTPDPDDSTSANAKQHQGGGGSDYGSGWGAGGSGIVIVKYPIPPNPVFNTSTAIALVDPRAESVQIPAVDLTSYVGNRSCITLDKPGESLDLDGSTNNKYKVEVIGASGDSPDGQGSKHLKISGSVAQMGAVFKPVGSSKSLIKVSRPTNSNFNEELTLTIKTDNRPGADCSTDSPTSTSLIVTIKPYGLGVNQKNTITLS